MKKYLVVVFSVFALSVSAQSGSKNFIDQNYIEVTGTAELEIVPDEIYLKIMVSENDDKSKQRLLDKEKAMISLLESLGINVKKDLSIMDFSSNFSSYWIKKTEIIASKNYQLVIHDAVTLGKVYVALEKIGISNITIEKVWHSRMDYYNEMVKVNAVKAGKSKAKLLVDALDQNIGKVLYVQENNYDNYRVNQAQQMSNMSMMVKTSAITGADQIPEIAFEKIKLSSSMLIRFEIKE